jgi:hypothetical protein
LAGSIGVSRHLLTMPPATSRHACRSKTCIHWRGEVDKIGDHWNPLHPAALELLGQERQRVAAIGDAWVFDVKRNRSRGRAFGACGGGSPQTQEFRTANAMGGTRAGEHLPIDFGTPACGLERLGWLEVRANGGCRVSATE